RATEFWECVRSSLQRHNTNRGGMVLMNYLVEVRWTDPMASTVARILSTLPDDVERETSQWPEPTSRAFCVLRAQDPGAVTKILDAINDAGADTRVIAGSAEGP